MTTQMTSQEFYDCFFEHSEVSTANAALSIIKASEVIQELKSEGFEERPIKIGGYMCQLYLAQIEDYYLNNKTSSTKLAAFAAKEIIKNVAETSNLIIPVKLKPVRIDDDHFSKMTVDLSKGINSLEHTKYKQSVIKNQKIKETILMLVNVIFNFGIFLGIQWIIVQSLGEGILSSIFALLLFILVL